MNFVRISARTTTRSITRRRNQSSLIVPYTTHRTRVTQDRASGWRTSWNIRFIFSSHSTSVDCDNDNDNSSNNNTVENCTSTSVDYDNDNDNSSNNNTVENCTGRTTVASFQFPPLAGNILVVGDGDFSYSVALVHENQRRREEGGNSGATKILATSLDTEATILATYGTAGRNNLATLRRCAEKSKVVEVQHNCNATVRGSFGCSNDDDGGPYYWDHVVWNFPYPTNTGIASTREGANLLSGFFQTMKAILQPNTGLMYVTLNAIQATTGQWDIEHVAREQDLLVTRVLPFDVHNHQSNNNKLTGYQPKRAYSNASIPKINGVTYIIGFPTQHQLALKKKYTTDFQNLLVTRSSLYESWFASGGRPSQIFQLLQEEGNMVLQHFWNIYQTMFDRRQDSICADILKKLLQVTTEEMIQSCKVLSDGQINFTVEEIESLLLHNNNSNNNNNKRVIRIDHFEQIYVSKFGTKPTYVSGNLAELLNIMSKVGKFYVQKVQGRSTSYLIAAEADGREICTILLEAERSKDGGKLLIEDFLERFETKFDRSPYGTEIPKKEIQQKLAKLSENLYKVQQQNGACWIELIKDSIHNNNNNNSSNDSSNSSSSRITSVLKQPKTQNYMTKKEVLILLKETKKLNVCQFKESYQNKFGRNPLYGSGSLVKSLEEFANPDGGFIIEKCPKGSTSMWIRTISRKRKENEL